MNDKIEQSLYALKKKKNVCRTSQDRTPRTVNLSQRQRKIEVD